ncbi:MAG: penicillin acylase family protein [Planctomycetaceae bacterium]|nr:penicillin acylase family protein [Planctomycetaceae bacterium]
MEPTPASAPQQRTWTRYLRVLLGLLGITLVVALRACAWTWSRLRASLPTLSGRVIVRGPSAPIRIDRDALGVPTVRAASWGDLVFGLGFLHAQERFFEMEVQRRAAAGELAEVFGPGGGDEVIGLDRAMRRHQFRERARQVVAMLAPPDRAWLEAYTSGVNAGLGALGAEPFEYLLLGARPEPWAPEDTVLVMLQMFVGLQEQTWAKESSLGVAFDVLPRPLAEFLAAPGTAEWDAPLVGGPIAVPPVPGPEVVDLRRGADVTPVDDTPLDQIDGETPGSNNWAVAGAHTRDGAALMANDMHLKHGVPATWYRACLVWPEEGEPGRTWRAVGVTLPGIPTLIAGSNGRVAWGLTNTEADWADLIGLDVDPADPDAYLTPEGPRRFGLRRETIRVKGLPDVAFEARTTIWGPVVDADHRGRPRALRWVAHDREALDLSFVRMIESRTAREALDRAARAGAPHLNFVVGDADGHIGWTVLGRIPRRRGLGGRVPTSWADGSRRWDGYLAPEEAPRIVDPPRGRIWTANARVVSGEALEALGFGSYDRGARASQIRDRLLALEVATEPDMLAIQLDDRALFLARWRHLLLKTLTPALVASDPRRGALRRHVEGWGGRAAIDSVGYRMVHEFRLRVVRAVLSPLTAPCRRADPKFRLGVVHQTEGPVWAILAERPVHLLDPSYRDWDGLLLAAVDAMLDEATADGTPLESRTWGERNTVRFRHLLSTSAPLLGGWLDLPDQSLPGGWADMPRIQRPDYGASQRLAVAPGRESRGYLHVPCGQSGHPLSPHYRDGHAAWSRGEPAPLLPGPTRQSLVLEPAS